MKNMALLLATDNLEMLDVSSKITGISMRNKTADERRLVAPHPRLSAFIRG